MTGAPSGTGTKRHLALGCGIILGGLAFMIVLGVVASRGQSGPPAAPAAVVATPVARPPPVQMAAPKPVVPATPSPVPVAKWYTGGTLQKATGLEWRKATQSDKLASAADMVAAGWLNKSFKPEIQESIGDVESLAFKMRVVSLVQALDTATSDPDPKKQAIMDAQQVSTMAAMLMVLMGWTA